MPTATAAQPHSATQGHLIPGQALSSHVCHHLATLWNRLILKQVTETAAARGSKFGLWHRFRRLSGASGGVLIAAFVIMLAMRS